MKDDRWHYAALREFLLSDERAGSHMSRGMGSRREADRGSFDGDSGGPDAPDRSIPDIVRQAHRPPSVPLGDHRVSRTPQPGSFCVVAAPDAELRRLFFVLEFLGFPMTMKGALVSIELEMATDRDVIVHPHESGLGYAAMVELWNVFSVVETQVMRVISQVENDVLEAILGCLVGQKSERLSFGPALTDASDSRSAFQLRETADSGRLARISLEDAACADFPEPMRFEPAVAVFRNRYGEAREPLPWVKVSDCLAVMVDGIRTRYPFIVQAGGSEVEFRPETRDGWLEVLVSGPPAVSIKPKEALQPVVTCSSGSPCSIREESLGSISFYCLLEGGHDS